MRIVLAFILTIPLLFSSDRSLDGGKLKARKKNPVNVHIISIGTDFMIDKTSASIGLNDLSNSVRDARAIVEKIKADAPNLKGRSDNYSNSRGISRTRKDTTKTEQKQSEVFSHLLLNEEATRENIRTAFKEVIKSSTSNDYFVFYFGGMAFENKNSETQLVPFQTSHFKTEKNIFKTPELFELFSLSELANFMNQIPAQNQLVISESGLGRVFAQNLQSYLFELDPDVALNTERNRIILTTVGLGYDASNCDSEHAPLMKYILEAGDFYTIFNNYYHYQYLLNKQEIDCSFRDTKYYFISQEKDYKKLLEKRIVYSRSRGAKGNKIEAKKQSDDNTTTTHALVIATNRYNKDQDSWGDLKNPLNDANSVSNLLEHRYGVEVTKIYNEPRSAIKKGIIALKNKVGKNDKLLVFIAGHGHYSPELSQGFIVTTDSRSLSDDVFLDSYLPMSTLNSLFDGFDCKPILTIMDVCYGASFEMNEADLAPENYANTKFDDGIDKFIKETDKSFSRVILASGADEVPDFWNNSLDHSPFADKLIKALENEKQFISPGKIFSYVRGNTTRPILKKFGKHEVTGDFLIKALN